MSENNALIVVERLDVAKLFSGDGMDVVLKEIETQAMSLVPDISTEGGRKEIASMAFKVARSKTLIDDLGKRVMEDAKKTVDRVNGYRKQSRDFLDDLKGRVRQPLDEWEAEQAKIKAEEEKREKEKIDARIAALHKVGSNPPFMEVATMTDDEYEDRLRTATEAHGAEMKRLADEEASRKAEAVRLEAVRKEQEQKAAELAEAQRKIDEANAKIESERMALEDEKRAEQERKDREAFEAKAKEDARIAAEKAATEKAEREAREKTEAEERVKAEAERKEALKPDKTKLLEWCDYMDSDAILKPAIEAEEAKTILYDALHALRSWVLDIRKRTEGL